METVASGIPGAAVLIPAEIKEVIEVVRNIALVAIPFVLWFASQWREKRRATIDLMRSIETAPEIIERLERLYKFRKYEEGTASSLSTTPKNPYEGFPDQFLFDSVIVLNYFEAACAEIEAGAVIEEMLYDSVRNSVIGMKEVILVRYSGRIGVDQSRNYVRLVSVANRWRKRTESYGRTGAIKIPN